MTKYLRGAVIFFLLSLQMQEFQAQGGTIFNDPQGQFSLDLATGWTTMRTASSEELGHYAYVQNGIIAAEMSIATEALPTAMSAIQYAPQGNVTQPQAPMSTIAPTPGLTYSSYQDPEGLFAILIPETFKQMRSSAGTAFQGPQGQVIHAGVVPSIDETLQNMVKDKQILDERDPQVTAGTKKIPGKLIIYSSLNPQTGQKFVITALGVFERNLLFTFTTPEEQFNKDADSVIQVMKSVDVHE